MEGIGLGLRQAFVAELMTTGRRVDWLEITPENWMFQGGKRAYELAACAERWPIVPHSVSLSIGGIDPLDGAFLDGIERTLKQFDPPFWSDHLCYSSIAGRPLHDLLPLPFTNESIDNTARRVAEVKRRLGTPLLLENATYYSHMPGCTMDEAEFIARTLAAADCGLLLDVNNVYVNSINHRFDARAFLDRLPMERVAQIHVAGHTLIEGTIIDTHIGPVIDEVWSLYRHALARAGRMIPTLVEWDAEIPPLDKVLDEVDRARAHAEAALAGKRTL